MKVFVIIIFGCAVVRSFFEIIKSIKKEESAPDIIGVISAFICMIISYIWFLNLITK